MSDLGAKRHRFGHDLRQLLVALEREIGLLLRWVGNWRAPAAALLLGMAVGVGGGRDNR